MDGLKKAVEKTHALIESLSANMITEFAQTNAKLDRTMVTVAQLVGKVGEMDDKISTKADISWLNERMDGFAGLLLDSRHRWAIHADVLVEHDKRLKKLEPPTA